MKPKMKNSKFYENYFVSVLAFSIFYLKVSNAIDVAPAPAASSNSSFSHTQALAVPRSEDSAQQIQLNAERIINL